MLVTQKDSFEYAKTMGKTIVSRTYRTLQKARRSAIQAFYFLIIKYTLIKTFQKDENGRVYTIDLNVQICVQILCRI